MVDLTAVRYLALEDAFEVDFEDGLTFLEPHSTIRKANRISPKAEIKRVDLDGERHEGFLCITTTARLRKSRGPLFVSCRPRMQNCLRRNASRSEPGPETRTTRRIIPQLSPASSEASG